MIPLISFWQVLGAIIAVTLIILFVAATLIVQVADWRTATALRHGVQTAPKTIEDVPPAAGEAPAGGRNN